MILLPSDGGDVEPGEHTDDGEMTVALNDADVCTVYPVEH